MTESNSKTGGRMRRQARISLAIGMTILATLAIGSSTTARPLSPTEEAQVQPVGKAVPCVQTYRIDETRVRDSQTIDFVMKGGQVYRNRLPYSCSNLGFEESFAYSTPTQELCSSDAITVIPHGGTCGLGLFQPVSGVKR